jgi:hypothetical protein
VIDTSGLAESVEVKSGEDYVVGTCGYVRNDNTRCNVTYQKLAEKFVIILKCIQIITSVYVQRRYIKSL